MNRKVLVLSATVLSIACQQPAQNTPRSTDAGKHIISASPVAATGPATPVPTKDGDYEGKGIVTKIDTNIGSVEMDHEEIKGLMPEMRMEFYVSDKKLLDGLKLGDRVEFVVRYKAGAETIVDLKKEK